MLVEPFIAALNRYLAMIDKLPPRWQDAAVFTSFIAVCVAMTTAAVGMIALCSMTVAAFRGINHEV